MEITNIHEADFSLSELVDRALRGEEVIIVRDGKPAVRLTAIVADNSPRQGGQWKGRVRIADDFDQLPDDLAVALGIDPA